MTLEILLQLMLRDLKYERSCGFTTILGLAPEYSSEK
jgi:hypothetical protein